MINEENKSNKIFLKENKKIKNDEKGDYITLNINAPFKKGNNKNNIDIFLPEYNKTISYNKSKYIKFFSTFSNKYITLNNLKNKRKNKTDFLYNKKIQTPDFFFHINKIVINSSYISGCPKDEVNIHNSAFPNRNIFKKLKSNKSSSKIKSFSFTKPLTDKYFKLYNKITSRNKLSPIIQFKKAQKLEHKKLNYHLTNNNIINQTSKIIHHRNLVNIENIYKQQKKLYSNMRSNKGTQNELIFNKIPNKKIAIKKIKYPVVNNSFKRIKILNESNEYLLEKIYKNQTVSNFNNKYKLKYKTNDDSKKENIKNLFTLLKKYQYSEKDKNHLFQHYNKTNQKKRYNLLYNNNNNIL